MSTSLTIALVLALVLAVALWISVTRGSRRARRRASHATDGEASARLLLEAHGYEIRGEQVRGSWSLTVDGELFDFGVRADLLVARDGELLVAEVKTGNLAPDPTFGPTRRQLLEYQLVFEVDGVLVVDADRRTISRVAFDADRIGDREEVSAPG